MHILPHHQDPVLTALADNRGAVLALSDERDRWRELITEAEHREFARGRALGRHEGRLAEQFDTAAAQRVAADHILPLALDSVGGGYVRLLIQRWAPPGWRGTIPDGMTSFEARRWLAHLHRKGDYRPGPASAAQIEATWRPR